MSDTLSLNPGESVILVATKDGYMQVAGTGALSGSPGAVPIPDVTSLSCAPPVRVDGARRGAQVRFDITCNAPGSLGSGDGQFKGFELWRNNGETVISLGRITPDFAGAASDPIAFSFFDILPDADEHGVKLSATAYGPKYENELNTTTPTVTVDILVSTLPPSGNAVPNVTSLSAGQPQQTTLRVAGRPLGSYAVIPMTYTAPNPLGDGDAAFSAVEYLIDNGVQTVSVSRGPFPFTGAAGDQRTDNVNSSPLRWPTTQQTWKIYGLAHSASYENALVRAGSTNATPYATVLVGPAGTVTPVAEVPVFDAGTLDASGNFTHVMNWNTLLSDLEVDWKIVLPLTIDPDSGLYALPANFGGVGIWVQSGASAQSWIPPVTIYTPDDFMLAPDGVTMYLYGRTLFTLDKIPTSPQTWTFVASSYDTSTPPQPNRDTSGNPTGPSVQLQTLVVPASGTLSNLPFTPDVAIPFIVSAKPTFPDPRYRGGSYLTLVQGGKVAGLYRVKANGTDWEPMVNGTTDVQDGTLGVAKIIASEFAANFATITNLNATNATLAHVMADYATFTELNATNATVKGILTAGYVTATNLISSPAIKITSGNVVIDMNATDYFKIVDTGSQSKLQWQAGGALRITNNIIATAHADFGYGGFGVETPGPGSYPWKGVMGPGTITLLDSVTGGVGFGVDVTTTLTATSASAGSETLPGNPVGFLIVTIAGVARKLPYYAI